MFLKRKKKEFPPGSFIPKPARVMAILQLCVAFTLIAWSCGMPFMGDLFRYKSQMLLYQNLMGDTALLSKLDEKKAQEMQYKFDRNSERFSQLPDEQKRAIIQQYEHLQKMVSVPFIQNLQRAWRILVLELPPFMLAWIFFSVVISILLLLRIEGARQVIWLLPLIAAIYAVDNRWNGIEPMTFKHFYPTEEQIVSQYLYEPLSSNILEQREQLLKGWQVYLVREWAKEEPIKEKEQFQLQIEKGEFAFNLALLKSENEKAKINEFLLKEPIWLLTCYVLWNLLFITIVNRNSVSNYEINNNSSKVTS